MSELETIKDFSDKPTLKKKFIEFKENSEKKMYTQGYRVSGKFLFTSHLETMKDFSDKPTTLKKKSVAKFIELKENFDLCDISKLLKISLTNQL